MTEDMILDKQIVAPLPPQGDGNCVSVAHAFALSVAPLPPQGDGNDDILLQIYG